MKAKFFLILTSILILTFGVSYSQTPMLYIDTTLTEGLLGETADNYTTLKADGVTPITFYIHVLGDASIHTGITNGFRIYSTDGADWGATVGDTIIGMKQYMCLVFAINHASADGLGADTVGFGGVSVALLCGSTGLPANFDAVPYTLTIGPVDPSNHYKHICLDSSYYPPTGTWLWAGPSVTPYWGGALCYTFIDPTTVASVDSRLPGSFALMQNYPNPFNPSTQVKFDVPTRSQVRIDIYNVLGQKVKTLVNEMMDAGSYTADWDGSSEGGSSVSSGVYFYKMVAGDYVSTKKMMMLK